MSLKGNMALVVLFSSILLNGCSGEVTKKQPMYNPNFITTLFHKDIMAEEPARHAKFTMEPAIKIMQGFHNELDSIGGLHEEDWQNAQKLQQAAVIASRYEKRINQLKKDMLPWGDAIIPHVRYMQQINNYINQSVAEILKVSKLGLGKPGASKKLLRQIEKHKMYQQIALVGYEHYRLVLTKGPMAYHLNKSKVSKLKKGLTYFEVVKLLQMPGVQQRSGEVIWVHNDVVLFARFKKGKLYFWKLNGYY